MNFFEILYSGSQIAGNEEIINQLFPNVWVFVSHCLATIFLFILIFKLAWKPTKKYMEKRTEEIQRNLMETEKARIEAEKNLELSKQKIIDSKNIASNIIETAEHEAQEKKQKIEMYAINKANHIEKETMHQLKKQEIELYNKMNLEVSKLALETAEIFMSKKITEKENKEIIDNIVNDLMKKVDTNNE